MGRSRLEGLRPSEPQLDSAGLPGRGLAVLAEAAEPALPRRRQGPAAKAGRLRQAARRPWLGELRSAPTRGWLGEACRPRPRRGDCC